MVTLIIILWPLKPDIYRIQVSNRFWKLPNVSLLLCIIKENVRKPISTVTLHFSPPFFFFFSLSLSLKSLSGITNISVFFHQATEILFSVQISSKQSKNPKIRSKFLGLFAPRNFSQDSLAITFTDARNHDWTFICFLCAFLRLSIRINRQAHPCLRDWWICRLFDLSFTHYKIIPTFTFRPRNGVFRTI